MPAVRDGADVDMNPQQGVIECGYFSVVCSRIPGRTLDDASGTASDYNFVGGAIFILQTNRGYVRGTRAGEASNPVG
jgi:hypothetical protein